MTDAPKQPMLLETEYAAELYRAVTATPLPAATDGVRYHNIAERWLSFPALRDALRAAGVQECFITGNASDFEKLTALAEAAPRLCGHRALLACRHDLAEILGCRLALTPENLAAIWQETAQTLEREGGGNADVFRPVPALFLLQEGAEAALAALALSADTEINSLATLTCAYGKALDAFCAQGGRVISLPVDPEVDFVRPDPYHAEQTLHSVLKKGIRGLTVAEKALFSAQLTRFFGIEAVRRGLALRLELTHALPREQGAVSLPIVKIEGLVALLDYLRDCGGLPQTQILARDLEDLLVVSPLFAAFAASADGRAQLLPALAISPTLDVHGFADRLAALASYLPVGSFAPIYTAPVALSRDLLAHALCNFFAAQAAAGGFCGTAAQAAEQIRRILC